MWASLVPLVQNSVWGYTIFPLYIRKNFVLGVHNFFVCGGTQFFPLIIRANFVWGYTVFPLYIRNAAAVFQINQAQFFPLIIREKTVWGVHSFSP